MLKNDVRPSPPVLDMTMSTNPYESPQVRANKDSVALRRPNWKDYSPEFNAAFRTGLIMQAVLAVVTVLVLDSGQTHRAFWVALVCQWAAVWVILFRRPMSPTRCDLLIVRYGIVPILALVAHFGPLLIHVLRIEP